MIRRSGTRRWSCRDPRPRPARSARWRVEPLALLLGTIARRTPGGPRRRRRVRVTVLAERMSGLAGLAVDQDRAPVRRRRAPARAATARSHSRVGRLGSTPLEHVRASPHGTSPPCRGRRARAPGRSRRATVLLPAAGGPSMAMIMAGSRGAQDGNSAGEASSRLDFSNRLQATALLPAGTSHAWARVASSHAPCTRRSVARPPRRRRPRPSAAPPGSGLVPEHVGVPADQSVATPSSPAQRAAASAPAAPSRSRLLGLHRLDRSAPQPAGGPRSA